MNRKYHPIRFAEFSGILRNEFPEIHNWIMNSANRRFNMPLTAAGSMYGRIKIITGVDKGSIPVYMGKRDFTEVIEYIRNNYELCLVRML